MIKMNSTQVEMFNSDFYSFVDEIRAEIKASRQQLELLPQKRLKRLKRQANDD